jgi:phosphohistidine swiveling domain-containing protein
VPLLPPEHEGFVEVALTDMLLIVKLKEAGGAVFEHTSVTDPAVLTRLIVNVPLVVNGGDTVTVKSDP